MSLGSYVAGWALLAVTLGCAAGSAWLLVRARYRWLALEARGVAFAVLAATALFVSHLLPLVLGVLSRGTAVVASLLVLAAASRVRPGDASEPEAPRGVAGSRGAWAVAAVGTLFAGAWALAFAVTNRSVAVGDVDATGFHLPVVARWLHDGSVWQFTDFAPGWAFGAYPNTGNVLQLAVVLPWHDDFLIRAVGTVCLLVCVFAVYGLATELGAPRPLALLGAVTAGMVPTAAIVGLNHGQTDLVAAAGFAAAALFAARHARTRRPSELVLAVLALGLAFGTKWYAPPEALAVLVLWTAARILGDRPKWRLALRDSVIVGLGILAVGGIWMLRNWVLSGDPLFPRAVSVLGVTLFSGTPFRAEPYDFALLHYLTDFDLMRDGIARQLERRFGAVGALLVAGAVAAALLAWRRRERVPLVVALASLLLLAVYVATPFTAQGPEGAPQVTAGVRYALPALMLAAAASAWLLGRLGRGGVAAGVLALPAFAHTIHVTRKGGLEFLHTTNTRILAAGVLIALVAAAAWGLRGRRSPVASPLVLAAVAVIALLVGGRKVQQDFDASRYRVRPVHTWLQTVPDRPVKVGLVGRLRTPAGNGAQIASFGPRMRNDAEYVGIRRHHLLQDHPTQEGFTRALERGRYDVLVVGLHPHALRWARAAGWRDVVRDDLFHLLAPPAS